MPPFQAFMDSHRDEVWRFLCAVAGAEEAEDCFQETFLAALRAYPRLQDASNLKGWVMTIAFRKAMDAHRVKRSRARPVESVPDAAVFDGQLHDAELWKAVKRLPPMQRAAVAHRYVNDLAYKDIADVLECSEDSARQNVRLGLRRLKEVLSE